MDVLDAKGGLRDALSELTKRDKGEKDKGYEVKIEALCTLMKHAPFKRSIARPN